MMDNGPAVMESVAENGEASDTQTLLLHRYYTLHAVRYSNVFRAILFVNTAFTCCLWLTGGDSEYFISSIVDFHFKESVFDLVMIISIKMILTFAVLGALEDVTMSQLNLLYDPNLVSRKFLLHSVLIFLHLFGFVYATVKGSLILDAILNDGKDYTRMHLTFDILAISAVAFGALELVLALLSFVMMRRLEKIRVLHWRNDDGEEVDKEGKPIKKDATLWRLITMAGPEMGLIIGGSVCLLISAATQSAAPLFFGLVVDAAQSSMADLNRTVVILLLIYLGGAISGTLRAWFFTLAGQRFVARLRTELFSAIIEQDIAFFDVTRTGELTNRLASDTQVLQNAVTVNVSMLARYILQILGSLSLMFYLNAKLTGVLLAVVPVVSICAVQYGKFVRDVQKNFQDRLADASTTAEESLSSIRTVRTFCGETRSKETYGVDIDKSYQQGKKLALAVGLFDGIVGTVSYGAITLVLWYGGKLVFEGAITPGLLTSFLLYTLQVAMAFGFLSSLYGDFMKAVGASVRIFELMDRKPVVPLEGGLSDQELDGSIQFEDVKFTYPSRPDTQVLKGVTFRVKPGQVVALVGPSGGGKSTIVSLIERLYDPNDGVLKLGGFELHTLNPSWFRSKVSMVSQEPTLFACSIKDNIAYGKKDATLDEIMDVAKKANAHEFVSGFEEGYDTLVGERGVRLSGGQKQRIAIARALIMDPAILLLDEATSALDAESEHLVQEAIDRAMESRTVLVIAHRLSTVRNAARVIVIAGGTIAEAGTHEQLLEKGGVYKKLVLRQLMAGGSSDVTGGGTGEAKENGAISEESGEMNGDAGVTEAKLVDLD